MLFGLAVGLAVAAGVYLRAPRSPSPATAPTAAAAPSEKKSEPRERQAKQAAAQTAEDDKRFQFYDILPQFQVVVPKGEPRSATAPAVARAATVQQPGRYLLQAGSFSTPAEADRLQATLALRGIESRVQQATVDGNVFYRVQIGPIDELEALNRTRRQLLDAGIEALPLKLRE
jgi:cell division protein FtsN